jgi:membrane-associated protease RseP (regulator of RpoE activity)
MDQTWDGSRIDTIVAQVLRVDDITDGGPKQGYIRRYRGTLLGEDSAAAYDRLTELLLPFHLTPLFRWDESSRHAILLVDKPPQPRESNPWINLGLFIATLISVFITGAFSQLSGPLPSGILPAAWAIIQAGLPFTVAMLAILGAHEFGHYLVGRAHGVHLTLPYFIPLPLISPFGTMGAFINMKEQPKNRRHLLDIGLAGPLAGVIVAIPVLIIGLLLSPVAPLPSGVSNQISVQMEGNSILYLLLKFITHGQLLPAPVTYGGVSPLLYWLRYFFTGLPRPFGGMDVQLHPVAWAAWGGLLVTSLNLIPAGQLDGGHALYVLIGRKRARMVLPVILVGLVALGFAWNGWWLWAGLIFIFGRFYAEPMDEITPLDPPRKALAVLGIVLFFLVFIPVPLSIY